MLYVLLLLGALLGPAVGEMQEEVQTTGRDVYWLIDLSESMNATDIQPSRLERVKFELSRLVTDWQTDRLGLIIFADEPFLQCPLTFDQSALNLFVRSLDTQLLPANGTNIVNALKLVSEKYEAYETPSKTARIAVLVTDGEDFGEQNSQTVNALRKQGIQLFVLGVGSETGSKILTGGRWKRDKEGNEIISRLNRSFLQKLATQSGGGYFEINEQYSEIPGLMKAIREVKGQKQESRLTDVTANKYNYLLLTAIGLMMLDLLITSKTMAIAP
jgi:Ca-activated chloride channel homolog